MTEEQKRVLDEITNELMGMSKADFQQEMLKVSTSDLFHMLMEARTFEYGVKQLQQELAEIACFLDQIDVPKEDQGRLLTISQRVMSMKDRYLYG